jgi:hypothetical protein
MQADQRPEQLIGEPAGLAPFPARLGDPGERGVGGGAEPVVAQPLADVTAQVHAALADEQPGIRRVPGRPVRVAAVSDDGELARRHPLLVADLVEAGEDLVRGRQGDDAAPVGGQHALRAEVGAQRHRLVGRAARRELERLPVREAASRHGPAASPTVR